MSNPLFLDNFTQALRSAIAAVCPVLGVSVGDPTQASTWSFTPDPSATPTQVAAGQQAAAEFSYVPSVATVTGRQIVAQVKVAGIGSALLNFLAAPNTIQTMPTSIGYWNAVALDTHVPVDNPKLANVLTGAGVTDVPAFMAAALLLPA